jgi:NADPH2:quinone reductase
MAQGVHYAPSAFPRIVGLDGIGSLDDGRRVAFFAPRAPYGGMAEKALVRAGLWLPVPDGVDDVTAAAYTNPGMAAWKTIFWEGELTAGQTALILGATGASGRIAAQLALRSGAHVVAAGRNQSMLDELARAGADTTIRVDQPRDELIAALADAGPYDLVVDYLWGPVAEAVFEALRRVDGERSPAEIRYILVGMTAGEVAGLPALTLRKAPVRLLGSGFGGPAGLDAAAAAYADLLAQVAAGELTLDIEAVPLARVEEIWRQPSGAHRVVFVP